MSEQTLKFDNIVVNKSDFHASKEAITLDLVESSKIHFIGYLHVDDVIRPLCIVLPPMCGYIIYFDNGRENMPFLIEDESVYLKYAGIWNKIKRLLSVKFHSQPIHDDKYIKTKVKTFGETINTLFSDNKVPKEKSHYICIAAMLILC